MNEPINATEEELFNLLIDAAKNWLAHDGVWFQAIEKSYGLDAAIRLDAETWERFSAIEAKRIMTRLGIQPNSDMPALIKALKFRLYAYINKQEVIEASAMRCVFRMNTCRVQEARKQQNLPDFPCKSVGLVEYNNFAKTIDPRIKTKCLSCLPDSHPKEYWCAWEFTI